MTSAKNARTAEERRFTSFDGMELFYRHWPALSEKARGAIVLFHRGHEHSGRVAHLVRELGLDDFAFFAWDARGNGMSPGKRGDAPGVEAAVRDVDCFIRHISREHGHDSRDMLVLAQSVGAVYVSAWAHDYAPRIRGLILGSPAFKVKLYVPFARQLLRLLLKLRGNFFVNSYVKARFLTHDSERIASFKEDPLIARPISARILSGLFDTADRIVADAGAIDLPVQLFISGSDWVVHKWPQHLFFNRLTHPLNERHLLPGFYHDTFGELDREKVYVPMRAFINRLFAADYQEQDLSRADRIGPSAAERKRLEAPMPPCSPMRPLYAGLRLCLWLFSRCSGGARIGRETGFDSGSMLDYVYRNTPTGSNFLGRAFDKWYLNGPGWSGIRVRKAQVEELMGLAASLLREKGMPVRVMDIAAGHGRYILDALAAMPGDWESAVLRDTSTLNVEKGQALIAERGLADKVSFVIGDAFSEESISAQQPQPSLAVVSGLYELFQDNDMLAESLRGLARALPEGGCFVYTNQPWHPQQELIARCLGSHRQGEPWIMRCRSQAEMDQLVRRAGFSKIEQRLDPNGIFTVSLAVRCARH
ncbi:bifunctional alpha/beta hydrolase/class I SAM-dependent methyltransferase [Desulfovibrio sp. OttesenSCG-928-A18]|nr:bifunctional alpha/beta hydrolase/class I SAM-dependent methyltransferase [Desulfovibrio sp. OttesenSCG-928-A18]